MPGAFTGPIRGAVERALGEEVPAPREAVHLALHVRERRAPDRVLQGRVEELPLGDDGLALREVGDGEADAAPGSLRRGVGRRIRLVWRTRPVAGLERQPPPGEVDPYVARPLLPLCEERSPVGGDLAGPRRELHPLLLGGRGGPRGEPLRSQSPLDLGCPLAEGGELGPLHVDELEHALALVAEGIPELLYLGGELGAVDGAQVLGRLHDLVVAERSPLAVGAASEVQHQGMGVELRVLLPARLVAELRHHQVPRVLHVALAIHLLASLGALLGGGDGSRDRTVVRLDEAGVPTHERLEGHALRRREGEVDADAVLRVQPRRGAARVTVRGDVAGEELTEAPAVHRPREPEILGSPAPCQADASPSPA
jgi:hypothetical protein